MGDRTRSALRRALDDMGGGLRSALGLEPVQQELVAELLGSQRGTQELDAGGRRRSAPRRKRRASERSPLSLVK